MMLLCAPFFTLAMLFVAYSYLISFVRCGVDCSILGSNVIFNRCGIWVYWCYIQRGHDYVFLTDS